MRWMREKLNKERILFEFKKKLELDLKRQCSHLFSHFGSGKMLLVRLIENKKFILILGQFRLFRVSFSRTVRKRIRIVPRRVKAPAGARNRKKHP